MSTNINLNLADAEVLLRLLLEENAKLKGLVKDQAAIIDNLSVNPNFGCLTRKALELEFERRKAVRPNRAIIGIDVAGMGKANLREGEAWVNKQIQCALDWIKKHTRVTDLLIGQLNSGDEFIFICPLDNVEGLVSKIKEIFNIYHLNPGDGEAIYIAWKEYDEDLPLSPMPSDPMGVSNSSEVMDIVYDLKRRAKMRLAS